MRLDNSERWIVAAGVTLGTVAIALLATGAGPVPQVAMPPLLHSPTPQAAEITPAPGPEAPADSGAAETVGPTVLRSAPALDAPEASRVRAGILLPVTGREGDFLAVRSPCHEGLWVSAADVRVHPPAPEGELREMAGATFVIDPGHGGSAPGAVGPGGLTEKEINLNLSRRVAELLRQPPDPGHGPARVFLTRSDDHDATLGYRTALANALNAHALVSIHNNAEPDGTSPTPGTETYYQVASAPESAAASRRMAGLSYEELAGVLSSHDVQWVSDRDAGAKYRRNAQGGDYYGILRGATVPSVLLEVMFISNPAEEQLLRQEAVQDQVARAIYRALLRFASSEDPGSGFIEPYPRGSGPSGALPDCIDPA